MIDTSMGYPDASPLRRDGSFHLAEGTCSHIFSRLTSRCLRPPPSSSARWNDSSPAGIWPVYRIAVSEVMLLSKGSISESDHGAGQDHAVLGSK